MVNGDVFYSTSNNLKTYTRHWPSCKGVATCISVLFVLSVWNLYSYSAWRSIVCREKSCLCVNYQGSYNFFIMRFPRCRLANNPVTAVTWFRHRGGVLLPPRWREGVTAVTVAFQRLVQRKCPFNRHLHYLTIFVLFDLLCFHFPLRHRFRCFHRHAVPLTAWVTVHPMCNGQ